MRARWWILIVLPALLLAGAGAWLASAALSSPSHHVRHVEDDEFGTSEVYAVDAEGALSPHPSDPDVAGMWEMFVRIVTPDFAGSGMSEYRVADDPDSDTMAYVQRDEAGTRWVLAANAAYAEDRDTLLATLIHEYAHILSLGDGEVVASYSVCETVELAEGCLASRSALLAFERQFWEPYGTAAPAPDDGDADAAWEFYLAHEDDFVSDYAATNVTEDFAESFAAFVQETEPAGNGVLAQKLRFFWQRPDYLAVRERIRGEFGLPE